jgi:hypothetical protein
MQNDLAFLQYRSPFKAICAAALLVVFSFFSCSAVSADQSLSKEKKLKAAYLWNFTQYIQWPGSVVGRKPFLIRICVDGSIDFLQFLQEVVGSKSKFKSQNTVEVVPLDIATGCELLFVSGTKKIEPVPLGHVVIVADSPSVNFPNTAVVFYQNNRKLRFEIDMSVIKELDVVVSSELLKLARIKQ